MNSFDVIANNYDSIDVTKDSVIIKTGSRDAKKALQIYDAIKGLISTYEENQKDPFTKELGPFSIEQAYAIKRNVWAYNEAKYIKENYDVTDKDAIEIAYLMYEEDLEHDDFEFEQECLRNHLEEFGYNIDDIEKD